MALRFNLLGLVGFLVALLPTLTFAGDGLVTCVGPDCNFCSLLGTTHNVIFWLFVISSLLAGMVLMYAGFKMVTAGGDTSGYVEAKKLFFNAVLGIIIILSVVTIVDTLLKTTLRASIDTVNLTKSDLKNGIWNGVSCGGQSNPRSGSLNPLNTPPPSGGGQGAARPTQSVPNLSPTECVNVAGGNYVPSTGACDIPVTPNTPPAAVDSDYQCSTSANSDGSTNYDCSAGIASCAQAGFGFEVYSGNNRVRCVPTNTQPPQTTPTPNCPSGTVVNGICYGTTTPVPDGMNGAGYCASLGNFSYNSANNTCVLNQSGSAPVNNTGNTTPPTNTVDGGNSQNSSYSYLLPCPETGCSNGNVSCSGSNETGNIEEQVVLNNQGIPTGQVRQFLRCTEN